MFIRKFSSISLDSYVIFSRISRVKNTQNTILPTLVILFRQTEIVLKDSTAFVYVTQSEKSSH